MLSLDQLTLRLGSDDDAPRLLSDVSATFRRGEFVAVIGPSGCGKSTLLKMIAGIASGQEEGTIRWDGRDLGEEDFKPSEFGYVPQFSIAHEELTVEECVDYSARLRVAGISSAERSELVARLLGQVGLEEFGERTVKVLSGGQKRRLALAMELVSSPPILLCDEVTSGLDPQSEEEIVSLLRKVAREGNRLVISVTHSLKNLNDYDAVVVLYKGVLAYAGVPRHLAHYFRVDAPDLVYSQLDSRDAEGWQASWKKHSAAFLQGEESSGEEEEPQVAREASCPDCKAPCGDGVRFCKECGCKIPESTLGVTAVEQESSPGFISQFATLTVRRFTIFFRSKTQFWLQVGMVVLFPLLVGICNRQLPQMQGLEVIDVNTKTTKELIQFILQNRLSDYQSFDNFLQKVIKSGSVVSGIVMLQVVLITLMGANNAGREIVSERQIFEKEKLSGLRPGAYMASKILFLGILSAVQSLWMGLFVHAFYDFPAELYSQLLFLFLVNAAMTSVCLAISSFMASAEQASLASIYLVGIQLPLSGAVLSLNDWLGDIIHPFIAAYWGWSGILKSLQGSPRGDLFYDFVSKNCTTNLSASSVCIWMLSIHIVAGILLTYQGCVRTKME
jgi:ABC-type multidrug transport system ATPase subunit